MNISDYFRLVRRNWLAFLSLFLIGVCGSLAFSLVQRPVYEATAGAYVSTQSASNVSDLAQGQTFGQEIVKSYETIATSTLVLKPVIDKLGLPDTPHQLQTRMDTSVPTETSVLNITVRDGNAQEAAAIANAVVSQLSSEVPGLSAQTSGKGSGVKVTLIEPAVPPEVPISPRLALNVVLGALVGLLLAAIFSVVRETVDTRVRTAQDVAGLTDRPVLGAIPFDRSTGPRPLAVGEFSRSQRAEAFRSFRTNLQFLDFGHQTPVVVFTSSIQGEGKSTSVANLAIALADAGRRVVLVDADLRRPRIADYFGVDGGTGLTDLLIGTTDLESATQQWAGRNLYLIPAGTMPPNPNELLQGAAMTELLGLLRDDYDIVLFDSPPLGPVSDAAILAKQASGAVVVAAVNHARKPQVRSTLDQLGQLDVRVLGMLLTMVPVRDRSAYYYGYEDHTATAKSKAKPATVAAPRAKARKPRPSQF